MIYHGGPNVHEYPFSDCLIYTTGSAGDIPFASGSFNNLLDQMDHGANMGPIWVLSAPDGTHVGPMNLAIRGSLF